MPDLNSSRRRRWMVRVASVSLIAPLAAISASAPSSPAEPTVAIAGDSDSFRRVVVSTSKAQFDEGVDNQGWWSTSSEFGSQDRNDNYIVGRAEGFNYRNFFTFKLPRLRRNVVAAHLVLRRFRSGGDVTETFNLYEVSTSARRLNNNRGVDPAIYQDLGSGIRYGRFRVATGEDTSSVVRLKLNADAIADINAARGRYFSIGGKVASAQLSDPYDQYLFAGSEGRGIQALRLLVK